VCVLPRPPRIGAVRGMDAGWSHLIRSQPDAFPAVPASSRDVPFWLVRSTLVEVAGNVSGQGETRWDGFVGSMLGFGLTS
jgi:hypothetical protein